MKFPQPDHAVPQQPRPTRVGGSSRGNGCCLLLIVVLLLGGFFGAVAVAKTGIVNVPYLSDAFYEVPLPLRVVDDQYNRSDISFTPDPETKTATLTVTEEQLTFLLRKQLQQSDMVHQSVQAVIEPEYIEVYVMVQRPFVANMFFDVVPQAENGELKLHIVRFRIGNLTAPSFLLGWIDGVVRENFLFSELPAAPLESINLFERRLEARVRIETVSPDAVLDALNAPQ